ncbi:MAG TPA: hypothetical protein VIX11_17350 [Candidatus Acidoferrum sp.]
MNNQNLKRQNWQEARVGSGGFVGVRRLGAFCAVLGAAALISASSAQAGGGNRGAQDKDGAGVTFSKQATAKDVGLPTYPGSRAHKDEKEDSSSVLMGLWGGAFGFKLAVMKMESNDAPEKIAEFYKKALAKYGTVLNCSDTSKAAGGKDKDESSNKLTCDDDKPERGGLVFKAGTKEKQHVVAIQQNGAGSLFQLVYVEARGDDKDKKAN